MTTLRKYFAPDFSEEGYIKPPVIDSHVHFWKYDKQRDAWITNDMKTLQQHYLPSDLSLTLKRNGVDGVVAVQADQSELETRFLCELAETNPIIKGVVGWVDLKAADLHDRLDKFSSYSVVKGWRHIAQAEPDDFLLDKQFQRGVEIIGARNYTYDILIYARQLKSAIEFVKQLPNQKLVVDHCAKPDIKNKEFENWKQHMEELAKYEHVYCKLSGLVTEAAWKQWSPADFYPYLDVLFKSFGPDRLMFGSDWPVMLLSGIYVQWKSLIEKYMEGFSEDDRENVFGGNAVRFYSLTN